LPASQLPAIANNKVAAAHRWPMRAVMAAALLFPFHGALVFYLGPNSVFEGLTGCVDALIGRAWLNFCHPDPYYFVLALRQPEKRVNRNTKSTNKCLHQ